MPGVIKENKIFGQNVRLSVQTITWCIKDIKVVYRNKKDQFEDCFMNPSSRVKEKAVGKRGGAYSRPVHTACTSYHQDAGSAGRVRAAGQMLRPKLFTSCQGIIILFQS